MPFSRQPLWSFLIIHRAGAYPIPESSTLLLLTMRFLFTLFSVLSAS
jgi:hypothetical protein